jgi:lantibiotic modifying enzyme
VIGDVSWYAGRAGVAVFFAALGRLTGTSSYVLAARNALPRATGLPAWLDVGRAGVAYATALVGQLASDDDLVDRAVAVLLATDDDEPDDELDGALPAGGDELDFLNGWSGALGVHLALLSRRPDDAQLRHRAERVTGALLEALAVQERDPIDGPGLYRAGLAHGASGIALVLDRAGRVLSGPPAASAAAKAGELWALDAARTRRSGGVAGRLDRTRTGRRPSPTWCWGGTGAIHAAAVSGPTARLEAATVDATLPALLHPAPDLQHVCCGEAGRAMALDEIGRRLARDDASGHAHTLADGLAEQALTGDVFRFYRDCSFQGTGLMWGRAGIGYALCRLADPEVVPDVLVLA